MISRFAHVAEDRRHHLAGHAVAGVDDDAELAAEVEELQHVLAVGRPEVHLRRTCPCRPVLPDAEGAWRCA